MMASVIVELLKEFYPWAQWVPLGRDPNDEHADGLRRGTATPSVIAAGVAMQPQQQQQVPHCRGSHRQL
eukprot:gene12054-6583_t